ncbi:MAG TPA: hypothetical protein ENH00_08995 [Actinobacteria bacterium]|nr:calcineurin-like phosphoesterase [bacterium BMS3Bbin01]HDH26313.1 hypothetical protein [Actinomycetota bacterium]
MSAPLSTFRFAVIADSHIRRQDSGEYPSDGAMVERNRFVVGMIDRLEPSFVIHLGDIVHPLPVEAGHEAAVRLAADLYQGIEVPLHHLPGNHDVGDKPNPQVAVPPARDAAYEVFERHWGPAYRSFDHGGCHFVLIDTPVLNSGLERERRQRRWLENDLAAAAGRRIFLFSHYPPFIRDRNEAENYDNLAEPARSWLIDLVDRHAVEAWFSGHVHNFLYNRHRCDFYALPSTGFVRPDYSELAAIPPEAEAGRDDRAKLGFFIVDVTSDGHVVRPVRTYGCTGNEPLPVPAETSAASDWTCRIGVTLRHDWMATVGFPTDGLDPFVRKMVRNDYPLLALQESRISDVRVPAEDIMSADRRRRLNDLGRLGLRFTVFSAGLPDAAIASAIDESAPAVVRWEIIIQPDQIESVLSNLGRSPVPRALAPIVPIGSDGIQHFVTHGFDPHADDVLSCFVSAGAAEVFEEFVYRVAPDHPVEDAVSLALTSALAIGVGASMSIELPRGSEIAVFDDDERIARRTTEALAAGLRHPDVPMFLDGFMDHDRGYYRRHGLIDRRGNPRSALHALINFARSPR